MDDPKQRKSSFAERAKAAISSVQQDDRIKQAADAAKVAAGRAQEASKNISDKVTQEGSWEELRGDIEQLTEIARAHHALILDLVDRVEALEARAGIQGLLIVPADTELAGLAADAPRLAPNAPALDEVIENAGRQRLAAYYLYSTLISGLVGDEQLAPARWPPELSEPMDRLGLRRFAPRSDRGLDAELTASEQALRRSSGRQSAFAELAADLINQGAFGACSGDADSVRVVQAGDRDGFDLELLSDGKAVGKCRAEDHWELVAQQLAAAPRGEDPLADNDSGKAYAKKAGRWLEEHGISHGVSKATDLASTHSERRSAWVHDLFALGSGPDEKRLMRYTEGGRSLAAFAPKLTASLAGSVVMTDDERTAAIESRFTAVGSASAS
jgi:hypothetical protein